MSNINQTLAERGSRYGVFTGHAEITQDLKAVMQSTPKWDGLAPDQREALEMVAHKIGRILNGDPDYDDSWVDIAGYVTLVANRLQGKTDSGNPRSKGDLDANRPIQVNLPYMSPTH